MPDKEIAAQKVNRLKTTADCISELDALCSLAEVADRNQYVKPEVYDGSTIEIREEGILL